MENANSKDYLEKIKIQVIENLKKTAHAPSVQMTDVPRTTLTGVADNDDDELDDADEDDNKDTRHTQRRWDERITRDDEFDESEDEEENRANGVSVQPGKVKRRNIMDYQNPNAVASDVEMDSGVATPEIPPNGVDDVVTAMAIEANAEVNAELMEQKSLEPIVNGEVGPSNAPSKADSPKPTTVDQDGDVEMNTDAPEEPAPVPQVEAAPSPAPVPTPLSPRPSPKAATPPVEETPKPTESTEVKQEVAPEAEGKEKAPEKEAVPEATAPETAMQTDP